MTKTVKHILNSWKNIKILLFISKKWKSQKVLFFISNNPHNQQIVFEKIHLLIKIIFVFFLLIEKININIKIAIY